MNQVLKTLWLRIPRYLRHFTERVQQEGVLATLAFSCKWALGLIKHETATPLGTLPPSDTFEHGAHPRIAVQIHCFYPEVLPELLSYVNRIPYRFDCYVSTDTEEKRREIEKILSAQSHANRNAVQCFPNRGRDVAPLLAQLPQTTLQEYDYLLHLHSKKSKHDEYGSNWMLHLLTTLLDSPGYIAAILDCMEREKYGMVFQTTYYLAKPALGWHGNKENCVRYLNTLGVSADLRKAPVFPAGNMFWAKTDAVMPAFAHGFTAADFPDEAGQVEGTLAHCVERCWGFVVNAQGYACLRVKPAEKTIS